MPAATLPEKAVAEIWRRQLTGRNDLLTEDGRPLRVIYPGMVSGDRGADFTDAVIGTDRGFEWGGVEIHVNSSGWWGHGHHADPAYNGVILHVVYHRDRENPVRLRSGQSVPTLVLEKYVDIRENGENRFADGDLSPALPCGDIATVWKDGRLEAILAAAGEERFLEKMNEYREQIAREGAGQALYAGIMESLGYAKNKNQMRTLAELLPLPKLQTVMANSPDD